ncbi:MAG: ABC transporter ATP-binding protein [Cyanophyceae cyanobacterium]
MLRQKIQQSLHLATALRLIWQSSSRWTLVRLVLLVLQGTLPVAALYLTKLIVDVVAASLTADQENFRQVGFLLLLAVVVNLLLSVCSSLSELVNAAQTERVTDYLETVLHAKSIEVDLEYYENPQYYDTLQRAQQEAPYRPTLILNHLVQVAQNSVALATMLGLLLSLYWGVAVVLFGAALPALSVRLKFAKTMYRVQRQWTSQQRQANYLSRILTGEAWAKEIRLFDLGSHFSQRCRRLRRQAYEERLVVLSKRAILTAVAQGFSTLLVFAVYVYVVFQTLSGVFQLGDLVLYYQVFQRGQTTLEGLLRGVSGLYEDNLFLTNLTEFLRLQPKVAEPAHPPPVPQPMTKGIVFEQVSFRYPRSTRQAINHVDMVIRPGEVVALVGENGSGKTTLVKLLCRLYEPTGGRIMLDGVDLRAFETKALRRQISVIFQDFVKYSLTARDNIGVGNLDATESDIVIAARRAGADDMITKLPHGYHTMLGTQFAAGEELSIGQWQKVALARAFLRDSQIVILDEPTSAMDPRAEAEVFDKFRQLLRNQAAVLISHRLSTVKMADTIYVMDRGKIVESGTHNQLMSLNRLYARLFTAQAQHYR